MDIVFDGPPVHVFAEVEIDGKSIRAGEWVQRPDGCWVLRLTAAALERMVVLTRAAEAGSTEAAGAIEARWMPHGDGWDLRVGKDSNDRVGYAYHAGEWFLCESSGPFSSQLESSGGCARLLEAAKADPSWAHVTKWPEVNGD